MKFTKRQHRQKLFWSLLLFVDVLLFVEALSTNSVWACIVVMILSEIIYFKGNHALFGTYDAKRKARRAARQQAYLKRKTLKTNK